jgi:hypothetical protein
VSKNFFNRNRQPQAPQGPRPTSSPSSSATSPSAPAASPAPAAGVAAEEAPLDAKGEDTAPVVDDAKGDQPSASPVAAAPKQQAVSIISVSELGFRRLGRHFTKKPTVIPLNQLSDEQLKALLDPALHAHLKVDQVWL